jgi:hypothetical protein
MRCWGTHGEKTKLQLEMSGLDLKSSDWRRRRSSLQASLSAAAAEPGALSRPLQRHGSATTYIHAGGAGQKCSRRRSSP